MDSPKPEFDYDLWYTRATTALIPAYKGSFQTWRDERRRYQTDLYYLSIDGLGLDLVDSFYCPQHDNVWAADQIPCRLCRKPLQPCPGIPLGTSFHREICNAFVQKNPDETLYNQDTRKWRLILAPRGSYKSSLDRADVVQWMICFPNVRVAIFSASPGFGVDIVKAIKSYFLVTVDEETGAYVCNELYTKFQQLFPEHLVPANKRGSEDEFTTPARNDATLVDPTVFTLPLLGNTAGRHCDLALFDDCISDVNCGPNSTEEERKRVGENLVLKTKIVMLGGYKQYVGTPYGDDDHYSKMSEKLPPDILLKLVKRAWEVLPHAKGKDVSELTDKDVNLLFPINRKGDPGLPFSGLKTDALQNWYLFSCQYLCNPVKAGVVNFTEQIIASHTGQIVAEPGTYVTLLAGDLAASDAKSSDFSCLVVGLFIVKGPNRGKLFIVDMYLKRCGPTELAYQIAKLAARWKPLDRFAIEKSPFAEVLDSNIMNQLVMLGYFDAPRIEWLTVSTQKDAKNIRALGLETWLLQDRLWFSSEITEMAEVTKQFVGFKPHSRRKDDVVDSIAFLTMLAPTDIEIPTTERERIQAMDELLRHKQLYDLIHEPNLFYPPVPQTEPEFITPSTFEGYPVFKDWSEVYGS